MAIGISVIPSVHGSDTDTNKNMNTNTDTHTHIKWRITHFAVYFPFQKHGLLMIWVEYSGMEMADV